MPRSESSVLTVISNSGEGVKGAGGHEDGVDMTGLAMQAVVNRGACE